MSIFGAQIEIGEEGAEDLVHRDADDHHDQRAGNHGQALVLLHPRGIPCDQDRQRDRRDQHGFDVGRRHRIGDIGQRCRGPVGGAEEIEVAFQRLVPPQRMGDLLEDDHHADRGQHPLDHGIGHEVRHTARPEHAESDLHDPRDHDGEQKCGKRAKTLNGRGDDHGQAGGRPAYAHRRRGEQRDDQPADDAGDHTGKQRCPRGERDAEAQRQRHQEHHQSGAKILDRKGAARRRWRIRSG